MGQDERGTTRLGGGDAPTHEAGIKCNVGNARSATSRNVDITQCKCNVNIAFAILGAPARCTPCSPCSADGITILSPSWSLIRRITHFLRKCTCIFTQDAVFPKDENLTHFKPYLSMQDYTFRSGRRDTRAAFWVLQTLDFFHWFIDPMSFMPLDD